MSSILEAISGEFRGEFQGNSGEFRGISIHLRQSALRKNMAQGEFRSQPPQVFIILKGGPMGSPKAPMGSGLAPGPWACPVCVPLLEIYHGGCFRYVGGWVEGWVSGLV